MSQAGVPTSKSAHPDMCIKARKNSPVLPCKAPLKLHIPFFVKKFRPRFKWFRAAFYSVFYIFFLLNPKRTIQSFRED